MSAIGFRGGDASGNVCLRNNLGPKHLPRVVLVCRTWWRLFWGPNIPNSPHNRTHTAYSCCLFTSFFTTLSLCTPAALICMSGTRQRLRGTTTHPRHTQGGSHNTSRVVHTSKPMWSPRHPLCRPTTSPLSSPQHSQYHIHITPLAWLGEQKHKIKKPLSLALISADNRVVWGYHCGILYLCLCSGICVTTLCITKRSPQVYISTPLPSILALRQATKPSKRHRTCIALSGHAKSRWGRPWANSDNVTVSEIRGVWDGVIGRKS